MTKLRELQNEFLFIADKSAQTGPGARVVNFAISDALAAVNAVTDPPTPAQLEDLWTARAGLADRVTVIGVSALYAYDDVINHVMDALKIKRGTVTLT